MARDTIIKAYDDIERKKDANSQALANRKVVLEVKVYDLDDNYLANESLETREADVSSANLDLLKDGVRPAWNAGQRPKAPANAPSARSGGSTRRSPSNQSRSSNSVSGQRGDFNKAVRVWAKTQPQHSELKDQGRIPGNVVADYQAYNPNWATQFFKGNPPEDLVNRSNGDAPAPAEQPAAPASNVEPAPVEPAQPGQVQDVEDPPMSETRDEDWSPTPAGFTGGS